LNLIGLESNEGIHSKKKGKNDKLIESESEERKSNEESKEVRVSNGDEVELKDVKLNIEESKEGSKKESKGTNIGSENKAFSQSVYSVGISEGDDEKEDNEENGNKEKTEEELEAEKELLLKMEWNVEFTPEYFSEENQVDEAIQSEKQEYESTLKKEKELGKKLWSLIGYICFFAFFSYIVFSQVEVSMFNMYNDSLKNNLEGVYIQSNKNTYINVTELSDFVEVEDWIKLGLTTSFTANDPAKKYFFINDYNYALESSLRFCFSLAKKETSTGKGPKSAGWKRGNNGIFTEPFIGKSSGFTYDYISNGFHAKSSHCRIFKLADFGTEAIGFINDKIISDQLMTLSIEVSFNIKVQVLK